MDIAVWVWFAVIGSRCWRWICSRTAGRTSSESARPPHGRPSGVAFGVAFGGFVYLKIGPASVMIWVGIKMLLKVDVLYIPTPISLAVITVLIGGSVAASLIATHGSSRHSPAEPVDPPFHTATAAEAAEVRPVWQRTG